MNIINSLRIKLSKRNPMDFLPPKVDFEKSYWYGERWEVMANKDEDDPNSHAVPTVCLWCGGLTPAYPLHESGCGGTGCHECGRTVDESYDDWIYRAEFADGCDYTLYKSGYSGSVGPKHAPHRSFIKDEPVLEMINPLLPAEYCGELLSFFRDCYKDGMHEKHDPDNFLWNVVDEMPAREYPHKRVEWVDVGRNDPFSEDILTAPIEKYVSECKSRRIHANMDDFRVYRNFENAWNNSHDANWMSHLLEYTYRRDVFGDRKMLTAMVECCELVLEDVEDNLLKALTINGIMPVLRGYIHNTITVEEDGTRVRGHCDPEIGDQFSEEDRTSLYAYSRMMYYCRDGLGGMNDNNKQQRVVGAIESAVQESLSSHYQPNLGMVIAYVCNSFYGSMFPQKDRSRKCAEILRKHFPAEFVANVMVEYRLRGE